MHLRFGDEVSIMCNGDGHLGMVDEAVDLTRSAEHVEFRYSKGNKSALIDFEWFEAKMVVCKHLDAYIE